MEDEILKDPKWKCGLHYAIKMLETRGYEMQEKSTSMTYTFQQKENENKKIVIWCYTYEKLNIEGIKEFISILETQKIKHGLLIFYQMITASAKKILKSLYRFEIEIFTLKELQYDITTFEYYCPHILCDKKEREEVLKRFSISELPILLLTDVVSRYFYFHKNDLIRIHRKNGSIIYRIVK